MADDAIHTRIHQLIDTEHELRRKLAAGEISAEEENERLQTIEAQLDQAWDLLRQRKAKREFGENPSDAAARPTAIVEDYRN